VTFDDGEIIETNDREILFSSYCWEFHRQYPDTPLLKKHHLQEVLRGRSFNDSSHYKLLEIIYWDVAAVYHLHTPAARDHITRLVYQITNTIYNDLTHRLEEYVVSLDILDFLEAADSPNISAALDAMQPNPKSIEHTYEVIGEELGKSATLAHNALALFTRSGVVKQSQVLQCIGPRGYVTEVDGSHMEVPILRSFTKGMRSLYNMALESRAASKSLYFSEAPLQDSEYFSRKLQLMTMAVEYLERGPIAAPGENTMGIALGNCCSTDYLVWRVRGEERVNDEVIYKGDLEFLDGKYYVNETTGLLERLNRSDYHLVGKTIKLRTVLGCKHHDSHGVCSVCFGGLGDNISPYANLGHICSAMMTQQSTQSVLSTKHLMTSSVVEAIMLTDLARRFFKVGSKGDTYLLLPEWRNKPFKLIVSSQEAYGLTDIALVDNVVDINPSRISAVEIVEVMVGTDEAHERHPIIVSHHSRKAVFTSELLQHLKTYHWQTDGTGNFVIDFSHWDYSKPILRLPQKEYSYAKHASEISRIVESRVKDITMRSKPDSPKATLMELFELVNSKLSVNIACLEVIIYTVMCKNTTDDNYALVRNAENAGLGVIDPIISGRSLSAVYAYESQYKVILDPKSFFPQNRNDHLLDVFIAPAEVVAHYKSR